MGYSKDRFLPLLIVDFQIKDEKLSSKFLRLYLKTIVYYWLADGRTTEKEIKKYLKLNEKDWKKFRDLVDNFMVVNDDGAIEIPLYKRELEWVERKSRAGKTGAKARHQRTQSHCEPHCEPHSEPHSEKF